MSKRITRITGRGMVTLRGDLSDPTLTAAVTAATGCAVPSLRQIVWSGDQAVAWMSPDELLLIVTDAPATVAQLSEALTGIHHLAADVSDARATFRITGPWRDILASGAPVDLHPDTFPPGEIRRTRLGQVAAAFWATDANTAELVCFASVAEFVGIWLETAATEGAEPNLYAG